MAVLRARRSHGDVAAKAQERTSTSSSRADGTACRAGCCLLARDGRNPLPQVGWGIGMDRGVRAEDVACNSALEKSHEWTVGAAFLFLRDS